MCKLPSDDGEEGIYTDLTFYIILIEHLSAESWVDLSNQPGSPDRVTPLPFGNGEEYLRLLREAQRESNQSSARVSLASSRRDTPRDSPHDSYVTSLTLPLCCQPYLICPFFLKTNIYISIVKIDIS